MGSTKHQSTPPIQRAGRSEPHRHKHQRTARSNEQQRKMNEQSEMISQGKIPGEILLFELDLHDCFELQMRIAAIKLGSSTALEYQVANLIIQEMREEISLSAPYGEVGMHAIDDSFTMASERVAKTNLLLGKNMRPIRRLQPMIERGKELAKQAIEHAGKHLWKCDYTMDYEPQLKLAS